MKQHEKTIQLRKAYGQATCERIIKRLSESKQESERMPEIIKIKQYIK
jgi:hypothetical protein